jgi:hypothetical protein
MNDNNLQDIKDTVTDAGKALLAYSKTGAAFLPFDGDLYVAVGTLASIAHVAGKSMDEAAPAARAPSQVPAELTDERIDQLWRHSCEVGGAYSQQFVRHFAKAIEREVRLSAVREARNEAQWISVDERLPEGKCLAVYVTPSGKQRLIRAMYVKRFSIEVTEDGDTYSEYREEDDKEYLHEGWYECIDNWGEYSSCFVNEGTVTHWQPLPAFPASPAASKEGDA